MFRFIILLVMMHVSACALAQTPPQVLSLDRDQLSQLTQEDGKAREIIRRADRVRAPGQPFRYTLTLTEHKNGRDLLDKRQVLDISMRFYKPDEQRERGEARALVRFVAPTRDKGKVLLSDLDKMWYYAPELRRPIPISRQQRLLGQVSNGDVVAADFDYSYISTLLGTEACGDSQCYKLSLTRRWASVPYPAILYWVEVGSWHPQRIDFLSTEGRLIKRSRYRDYQQVQGMMRPATIVIEDALRKDSWTTMAYSEMVMESLPESYFQKDYLIRGSQ